MLEFCHNALLGIRELLVQEGPYRKNCYALQNTPLFKSFTCPIGEFHRWATGFFMRTA